MVVQEAPAASTATRSTTARATTVRRWRGDGLPRGAGLHVIPAVALALGAFFWVRVFIGQRAVRVGRGWATRAVYVDRSVRHRPPAAGAEVLSFLPGKQPKPPAPA